MYSTLEDSRRADERAAAQGYEVEDWAGCCVESVQAPRAIDATTLLTG